MIVAYIPARGGSKRLPGKNIMDFHGHPLIAYSIRAGLEAESVDRVIVSTENEAIAEVARRYGAEVLMRPEELAGDHTPTGAVTKHVAESVMEDGGTLEALVLLQPTNPLRPHGLVDEAVARYRLADAADSVFTVSRNEHKLGVLRDGRFVPQYTPGTRSQDMEKTYYENGLVYVTRPEIALQDGDVFGRTMIPLVTERLYALGDIDDELDFHLTEFLFEKYRERLIAIP